MDTSGFLGWAKFEFHFPFSSSLKEKRAIIHSLKERMKARTGASVAEVGDSEKWQTGVLVASIVSNESGYIEKCWAELMEIASSRDDAIIIHATKEWR